ncbi:HNH endonuclease [Aureimonas sp. D3]|uniref:HNH endonuclease n=1 Tax=Aureimonas sp. D3 TaxID=1638164 RepID=UPI0009ECC285|nr:HNH endonuclease [Aureimonas sp. D3]
MPVTQGAGNPDWTKEETLLALELLARHDGRPVDRGHRDVIELSQFLRRINIHPMDKRRDNFRNVDGVALKLQNLLSAIDPNRGLASSIGDRQVVSEFPPTRYTELRELAALLRLRLQDPDLAISVSDEETFTEGKVLTARHRYRDARLRGKLLAKMANRPLVCEMCGPGERFEDRSLAEAQYEAHHRVPLSTAEGEVTTKLSDMALLCACCHRLLHRLIAKERRWVSVEEAAEIRKLKLSH